MLQASFKKKNPYSTESIGLRYVTLEKEKPITHPVEIPSKYLSKQRIEDSKKAE